MELKTLKEIEWDESGKGDCLVDSKKLRKEAIKWIKSDLRIIRRIVKHEKERIGTGGDFTYIGNPSTEDILLDESFKRFIKHFFNITDKDLKEDD